MKDAQKFIRAANVLTSSLLRRQWKPLLVIFTMTCLISMQFSDALLNLGQGDDASRWMLQLSAGVFELAEGVFVFLVLSWGLPHVHDLQAANLEHRPFDEPYLDSFLAEYMRFLACCLAGALLILPGIAAYCLLAFVPYIAIFSKSYRADEKHALKYSIELTKKFWPHILTVFLITFALQLLLELLPHMVRELYNLPVRVSFLAISLLIGIWTYSFMFTLFEKAVTEENELSDI